MPQGPFDRAAQRALCEQVMRVLQFDFDGGRLDVSSHPFSGGVPEDVRLTTRFRDDEFVQSLMGTVHETGHGRYEQNLPRELLGQPVAEARSMAHPRKPEPVVRDAGRLPSRLRRAHRAADPRRLRRPARARDRQPAAPAHARAARLHPRRCRRGHLSGPRHHALRDRARPDRRPATRSTTSPRCGTST